MEIRHYRYFVALAEELHFARAAERLAIAPPTLTVQIQEMERILSAKLFARTKRSVVLTSAGAIFLVEARNVLLQVERADSVASRAGRGEIGRIEIGYVGSAAYSGILQEQTSRFRQSWPGVDINAREFPMDDLPRLVGEGHVDLGLVRLPMALPGSLRMHVLVRDYFCVAFPGDHPQAGLHGPVHASAISGEAFITPEQTAGTYEAGRRGRFTPRIISAPGSLLAVLTQVSLGAGVSIIPSVLTNVIHMPNVIFRPLAGEPIPSEVAAIFRSREASPAMRKFAEQIVREPALSVPALTG